MALPQHKAECRNSELNADQMQMLAVAKDYSQEPVAADDAASAMWLDVQALNPEGESHGVVKF